MARPRRRHGTPDAEDADPALVRIEIAERDTRRSRRRPGRAARGTGHSFRFDHPRRPLLVRGRIVLPVVGEGLVGRRMDGSLVDAAPGALDPDPLGPLRLGRLLVEVDHHFPEMADELVAALLEEPLRALVVRAGVGAEPDLLALGSGLRQLARAFLDPVAQLGADPVARGASGRTPPCDRSRCGCRGRTTAARRQGVPPASSTSHQSRSRSVNAVQPLDEERRIALVPVRAPERTDELDDGGRSSWLGRRKR